MVTRFVRNGTMHAFRLFILAFFVATAPSTVQGQAFLCTEATAGQLSCQAGTVCECRFAQASAMEGTPAGWRWDCGIMRPRCPGSDLPATVEDYSDVIPDSLSITNQSVDIDQANEQIQWIAPVLDF